MSQKPEILRRWVGLIRSEDEAEYTAYIQRTGGADYTSTPGNLGFQMLMRDLHDGTTEVTTLSWWGSMAEITAFAGDQPELARYYPEDDRFLLRRPKHVEHYRIVAAA